MVSSQFSKSERELGVANDGSMLMPETYPAFCACRRLRNSCDRLLASEISLFATIVAAPARLQSNLPIPPFTGAINQFEYQRGVQLLSSVCVLKGAVFTSAGFAFTIRYFCAALLANEKGRRRCALRPFREN